jgi:acyl CoA:acetate/3-ketoacid CoA transferase alpha subunit
MVIYLFCFVTTSFQQQAAAAASSLIADTDEIVPITFSSRVQVMTISS